MRKERPDAAIAAIVVSGTIAAAVVVYLISLLAEASSGEQLAAVAAIVGGLIGAAGTALAVYLTLASQRRDEAEKVEAALLMEVAEFGRLAAGALAPFEGVLKKEYVDVIPLRDLPVLTALPEPVVYKATADRISRLPYGTLFVSFHARIAEARQFATLLAITARPEIREGAPPVDRMLDERVARTLLIGWYDICTIAQSILRKQVNARQLAAAAIGAALAELDDVQKRIAPLVTTPEDLAAAAAAIDIVKKDDL